ncbi:MAG: hypothetical protein ABR555_05185 [Pyrinomonadaceae bacterium]
MSETLLISVIAVIDLIAALLTAVVATKAANHDIPTFLKGVIGAIIGIVIEVARVFAAMAFVGQSRSRFGEGQHVQVEALLGNTELWRMIGFVESSKCR